MQLFSFTCANLKLISWESLGIRVQMSNVFSIFVFIFSLFSSQYSSAEVYHISPSHPLAQGQTLVSPDKIFEFGFFSFNNSATLYAGLWHKSMSPRKYVWVANRENPLAATDTFASLRISSNGNLELVDGKQNSVWSTNISASSNSTSAVLLDNGNFVLKDDMGADLWESFDDPTDSLLPSLVLGFDGNIEKQNFLTSWKSGNDPSTGIFKVGLSAERPSQLFIWVNESTPRWRSGPWDKSNFIGDPTMNGQYTNPFTLVENVTQGTRYISYTTVGKYAAISDISAEGILKHWFSLSGMNWSLAWEAPRNPCDSYGACGPFGICKSSESPVCKCLDGFIPKSDEEWSKRNWTGGCLRKTKLLCERQANESLFSGGKQDEFLKIERLKVPDYHEFLELMVVDVDRLENCKTQCLNNCSCKAYAYVDNIGCLVWSKGYLIDIQQFSSGGADVFIRLAHSEFGKGNQTKLIVSLTAICFISVLVSVVFGLRRLRSNKSVNKKDTRKRPIGTSRDTIQEYVREHDGSELLLYNFDSIVSATNNFSNSNKLGEGGFGPVYKGKLQEGKEIAVKRLSRSSGQGIQEFKNEMLLIAKLQHKNLVRIMGCCITEDEKLLIYEFMPNKSLDTLLFDPSRRAVLDWNRRFNIICGVARGLLYLHHDSCLKVIHRDLKVSNILLDEKMNPKISDFGLSRIVEGTKNVENTQKVAGTLGYMSPEYALRGIFSEKSDVYSFGVLVLEIINGRKNTSFFDNEELPSIVAYAWNFWNEGRGLDLVDEVLADSYCASEVMKCVHVGLLCVQANAADRPSMPEVVFMLSNSNTDGPQPKEPIFIFQNSVSPLKPQFVNSSCSANEASITMIEGR